MVLYLLTPEKRSVVFVVKICHANKKAFCLSFPLPENYMAYKTQMLIFFKNMAISIQLYVFHHHIGQTPFLSFPSCEVKELMNSFGLRIFSSFKDSR